jgi:hypothetical protein
MTIIRQSPMLGGMQYPFLRDYDWEINTTDLFDDEVRETLKCTKGIAVRIVKDDKVVDIRVGRSTKKFLEETGLWFSDEISFVLSKRISRIMRPFMYWDFLDHVKIHYDATLNTKQWDGAGLIRREFLDKLCKHVPQDRARYLKRQLRESGRVEFTVMSERGQDKGHALVVDELAWDIVLPCDTKTQVKLLTGKTFVGVSPIHHAHDLWLDIQSLINFHPFMNVSQLLSWLNQYGDQHLLRIRNGELEERLRQPWSDLSWGIRDYLSSGGKAMWFAGVVKALANQHLIQIHQRSLKNLRIPIPGGRYYVFNDVVGSREVPVGHVELDPDNATAWVSRHDWAQFAAIWGGADMDDALCIVPFHDWDGDLKLLSYRNPNALGEYVVLRPTDSTVNLFSEFAELDSRLLPTRVDQRKQTYLTDAVIPEPIRRAYSVAAMQPVLNMAINNLAMMPIYINTLMVLKAMDGDIPKELPMPLEQVIDAHVKNGADLNPVRGWVAETLHKRFAWNPELPALLHRRIENLLPDIKLHHMQNHWLNDLHQGVVDHITQFEEKRDALMAEAMPPLAVFQFGQDHLDEAGIVRNAYGTVAGSFPKWRPLTEDDFARARTKTREALEHFPVQDWRKIFAAVAIRAYAYGEESVTSDAVLWQLGKKQADGSRDRGPVQLTLDMLRECGVIGDWIETTAGQILYYSADVELCVPIRLNGVWFDYAKFLRQQAGLSVPEQMRDVPKLGYLGRDQVKAAVETWCRQGKFDRQRLVIVDRDGRKITMRDGRMCGIVDKHHVHRLTSDSIEPKISYAHDGNLIVLA